MFDQKAYMKKWHKNHPHYMERYYLEHKEKIIQYSRHYSGKNKRWKSVGYGGVCFCPRCGKKGYKRFSSKINILTGHETSVFTWVEHNHYENGKTVYDGVCYIGKGRL